MGEQRKLDVGREQVERFCSRVAVHSRKHLSCPRSYNRSLKEDIKLLEKVQNYFTRVVFHICYPNTNYPAAMPTANYRNLRLGLPSLETRRFRYDMLLCFKILKGVTNIDRSTLYEVTRSVTRGPQSRD